MNILTVLKVVLIIILCIGSSYTDIKFGYVKNLYLLPFPLFGTVLLVLQYMFFGVETLLDSVISILTSLIISVILYIAHIWAAGDCKLLIALSLLAPVELYSKFNFLNFSIIFVIAFAFAFSYIFLIFDSIYCGIKQKKIADKAKIKSGMKSLMLNYISSVCCIIAIDNIFLYFFYEFFMHYIFVLLAINISFVILLNSFKRLDKRIVLPIALILAVIFICLRQSFGIMYIVNFGLVFIVILMKLFISEYNYEYINTSDVKAGMIISTETSMLFLNSRVKGLPDISNENISDRLSESECESIRRWEKSSYGSKTVKIVRKIPFAIFISLGIVTYIIVGVMLN